MHVYRGQRMSKDELDILKNNIGKYISINTFLSTSTNRNLSLSFINGSIYWKNVERQNRKTTFRLTCYGRW